jgi:transposase
VWLKRRWCCRNIVCDKGSWTDRNDQIAHPRQLLTCRAALWVTRQVGEHGRTVSGVADELGCDWHTANDTAMAYGEALLEADKDRLNGTTAVGLDETLFNKTGEYRQKNWCTSIVNVISGKLLDIVKDRTAVAVCGWFAERSEGWISGVRYGTLDMSGTYRKVFDTSLPEAVQIVDPFHLVKHAGSKVDESRCRIQTETLGHRGRKGDPLYQSRMLLLKGDEKHTQKSRDKLDKFLEAGDPNGELRECWLAKEAIRDIYKISDPEKGQQYVLSLIETFKHKNRPQS